jgi:hypothetical protein
MDKINGNWIVPDLQYIRIQKWYKRQIANTQQINGAIRRDFGKQMNKETKLRFHNITAKAVLKLGSEIWYWSKERNNV